MGELAADHGADLRHLLDRRRAGRAAPSASPAASPGSRAAAAGRRARSGRLRLATSAGFEHRLGQLLDEQRHAVGLGDDLVHALSAGSGLPPATRSTIAAPLAPAEPAERAARVTCAWPAQGGANSGRKVTSSSTRQLAHALDHRGRAARAWSGRSSARPRTSTSTGCCAASPSSWLEQRLERRRLLLLRASASARG